MDEKTVFERSPEYQYFYLFFSLDQVNDSSVSVISENPVLKKYEKLERLPRESHGYEVLRWLSPRQSQRYEEPKRLSPASPKGTKR